MRKLKIAFLSGGRFTHIGAYLEFFKERGHDVRWIKFDRSDRDFGMLSYDIFGGASGARPFSKWKYLLAGVSIRKILRDIKPDILHGHYATSAGVISVMSGFRPFVISVHGSDVIGSMSSVMWRRILQSVFKRAAGVNVVSQQLAELTQRLGVPEEKILELTQGVDVNLFDYKPSSKLSHPVRLICTRALKRVCGMVTIINACETLQKENVPFTLTLAASGPLQNQLVKMVSRKGLSENMKFIGGYDNKELPAILRNHDIYVSASLWDGTSVSLLEAMACGLFPVVSRIESNQVWVKEGKTALMFECGRAEELAEKIKHVVCEYQLRRSAILENRKVVEEKANREKNMLVLEKWYYEILGQ